MALDALRKIPGTQELPLQPPSSLNIMFHRNDAAFIASKHNGKVAKRKPDVVIVSEADAQFASAEEDKLTWRELALGIALTRPTEPFTWRAPLSCQEFKRIRKKLPGVPRSWSIAEKAEDIPTIPATKIALLDWDPPVQSLSVIAEEEPTSNPAPESDGESLTSTKV